MYVPSRQELEQVLKTGLEDQSERFDLIRIFWHILQFFQYQENRAQQCNNKRHKILQGHLLNQAIRVPISGGSDKCVHHRKCVRNIQFTVEEEMLFPEEVL